MTDERVPVAFLAPGHDVLTKPNRITSDDFEGWFQERGSYFPEQLGQGTLRNDSCNERPGRGATQERHPGRQIWQRLLHLYRGDFFPPTPGWCARRVPAIRKPGFSWQMMSSQPPDRTPPEEPPGVPGFRSWPAVYLAVFGWFVLIVVLLALFTRAFS